VRSRLARSVGALAARSLEALIVLWALASLVFLAMRTLPGDPAALILGDQASRAELDALRAKLLFDRPLHVQYAHFSASLATLDFGESLRRPGVAAAARVTEALGPTAELAALGVGLGALGGIAAAVLASGPWLGRRRVWIGRGLVVVAASPLLAIAPLLTYVLAARWRVVPLPGDPDAGLAGLLFASALLAIPLSAHVGRITSASLASLAGAPFLAVARAKGGTYLRVWAVHALPAVIGPTVMVVATQLGALLGGAVVLERLFERAGLGTLILEAYATRDLPVLESAVIAAGGIFVAAQGLAAAVHALVDPRTRA